MRNERQFNIVCMDCFKETRKPLMFWRAAKCEKCKQLSWTINLKEWENMNDTSRRIQAPGTIVRRQKEIRFREDKRAKADFARQSASIPRCVKSTQELGE